MDDKDKMSLIVKLLDDHKRIYPHHSPLCELCKEAEAAIAAPLPVQPDLSKLKRYCPAPCSTEGDDSYNGMSEWPDAEYVRFFDVEVLFTTAAPLPELTGPSALTDDKILELFRGSPLSLENKDRYAISFAHEIQQAIFHPERAAVYAPPDLAASPSPAPAQPTGPLYEEQPDGTITQVDQSDLFGAAPVQQQWISVDDRLPEAEMSVLVMAPEWERPCIAAHFPGDEMNRAEWQDDSGDEVEPPPTAWMQLPEFSASPVPRVGGIASKESVETAAPGASTEDKQ